MLQFSKVQSETSREPASDRITAAEALQSIANFFRRQSSVILFATFLATALGVIYLVTARPIFTGQVQLLIDTHKVQGLQVSPQLPFIQADTVQVESQVGVLKSENIASAVIEKLHLAQDAEFIEPGGGLLAAISSFVSAEFEFADRPAPSEFELFRRAIGAFKSRLTVTRIPQSYIIQIDFRSYNAERAAQIANAIADGYIVDQLEAKYKATRQAGGWLQDRIKELQKQVSDAERDVVQFKTKHNIVSTGGTDRPLLNQLQVNELSSQLTIARANTAEARARLDRINSINKTDLSVQSLPDVSFGATVTDTLKNEIVTKLWGQYLDLAALERSFSTKYGPNHFAVVNLRIRLQIEDSTVDRVVVNDQHPSTGEFARDSGGSGSRRHLGRLGDDRDVERRALALDAFNPQCAAHQLGQPLADRKTEAGAPVLACGRRVELAELLEQPMCPVSRDTDAGVTHGEMDLVGIVAELDRHHHLPSLGELDRVAEQVHEDLAEAGDITVQSDGNRWVDQEGEFEPLARCRFGHEVERRLHARPEVVRVHLQLQSPRVDLREVEDVVDDPE